VIITRTPFRVSLFGGGTDHPAWYREHDGAVLGFALNRYCWITVRRLPPFFEHRHRLVYTRVETVRHAIDIEHPAARAVLGAAWPEGENGGLEIHHDGDLPAKSGLGSSSAFTVGMLNAVRALRGQRVSKRCLATEAILIEQSTLGEAVGSQDQVWAAHGGLNRIDFAADDFTVTPLVLSRSRVDDLLAHLVLYFTGFQRFAVDVEAEKISNTKRNAAHLTALRAMVDEADGLLASTRPLIELGELLHASWLVKRELASEVSNPTLDAYYDLARRHGAVGGKLLGAGGGGFFLFVVPPRRRADLRRALVGLVEVGVGLDRDGSRVVLYEPNGL